jgi:hypothetical protein
VERGAFEARCGALGTHAVMLRYAHKTFPTELRINSWLPASTSMRILAQMGAHQEQIWTPMTQGERGRARAPSVSDAYKEERHSQSTNPPPASLSAVVTGCGGVFTELWSGTAHDVRVNEGLLKPPVPALFATDTLYVQVCGLAGSGIGAVDGGNTLEGLKAVELSGALGGDPKGLVQHPDNWVAYWRDDADPGEVDGGGEDRFVYGGFEPFGLDGQHRPEDTAAVTIDLPAQWTPPLASWRHLVVTEGGNATLESASLAVRVFVFTVLPQKGTLQIAGIVQDTGAQAGGVQCAQDTLDGVSIQLEALQELAFVATTAGAQNEYAALEYVECIGGSGFSSPRAVRFSVWCGLNHRLDSASQQCMPCPPGSWLHPFSGAERCASCPPGSTTGQAAVQRALDASPHSALAPRRIEGTECWACGLGAYASRPGSAACARCPVGTFANESGSRLCQECPLVPRPIILELFSHRLLTESCARVFACVMTAVRCACRAPSGRRLARRSARSAARRRTLRCAGCRRACSAPRTPSRGQ